MKYSCTNQVVRYLQERPWTWLSIHDIMDGTSLPSATVTSLVTRPENNRFIETRNREGIVEYRLIGQHASVRRRVAEYLRTKYPEWVNSAQVAKGIGFETQRVAHILGCEMYRLPIEHRIGLHRHNEYRYVPDDERSLAESVKRKRAPRKRYIRNLEMYELDRKMLAFMEQHRCEWFTATDLCSMLNLAITPQSAGTKLSYLAKRHTNIRMTKKGHLYTYACMFDDAKAGKVEA